MDNYLAKLTKGAGIIFLIGIITSGFGYLIRSQLAQKLSTQEFGLFFAVYNIVLLIGWVKGFGLNSVLKKFIPQFRIKKDYFALKSSFVFITSFTILTSLIVFVSIYFFPEHFINSYFKSEMGKSLLLLLTFYIIIDDLSKLISSYFLSIHHSFLFSLRDLIIKTFLFGSLFFIKDFSSITIAFIYIVVTSLALFTNILFFLRHFPYLKYKSSLSKKLIKDFFSFSLPLLVKDFFGILMARVDNIFLIYFRPLTEVAIYNAILPTVELLHLFSRPFAKVLFPIASEMWEMKQKNQLLFILKMIHKHLFLILVPLSMAFYLFSNQILTFIFGSDYSVGSFGLKILVFGFILAGLNMVSSSVLMGLGKTKEIAFVTISRNILNVGLNILLIPFFGKIYQGYLGAIISTMIGFVITTIFFVYYLKKYLNYDHPFGTFFFALVSGLATYLIAHFALISIEHVILQGILFIIFFLVIYPLLLFLFGVTSIKELKNVFNFVIQKQKI
jgi:O-antigen/teichoic acid export membrane protein